VTGGDVSSPFSPSSTSAPDAQHPATARPEGRTLPASLPDHRSAALRQAGCTSEPLAGPAPPLSPNQRAQQAGFFFSRPSPPGQGQRGRLGTVPTTHASGRCRGSCSREHASAPRRFCGRSSSGPSGRFSLAGAGVSGRGCDRKTVGPVVDPTRLLYLIHRYYDPATGQFLNRDPLVGLTHAPYAYVGDNPVNNTDPTGLIPRGPGGSCTWGNGQPAPPSLCSPPPGYGPETPEYTVTANPLYWASAQPSHSSLFSGLSIPGYAPSVSVCQPPAPPSYSVAIQQNASASGQFFSQLPWIITHNWSPYVSPASAQTWSETDSQIECTLEAAHGFELGEIVEPVGGGIVGGALGCAFGSIVAWLSG
jgi:RHS repeat-associated protein